MTKGKMASIGVLKNKMTRFGIDIDPGKHSAIDT